jgi:hypothetical protein
MLQLPIGHHTLSIACSFAGRYRLEVAIVLLKFHPIDIVLVHTLQTTTDQLVIIARISRIGGSIQPQRRLGSSVWSAKKGGRRYLVLHSVVLCAAPRLVVLGLDHVFET